MFGKSQDPKTEPTSVKSGLKPFPAGIPRPDQARDYGVDLERVCADERLTDVARGKITPGIFKPHWSEAAVADPEPLPADAGYKDRMDAFYSFIPGMNSRIGNHIEFPNYEADELVEIGVVMCRDLEYDMTPNAIEALRAYMTKRMTMPFFANARTVRNVIDLGRMRSAIRIFNEKMADGNSGDVNEAELMTITEFDFPTPAELEAECQKQGGGNIA